MVFRPRWTSRAVRCWARAPGAAWWHRGTTGGTQRGIKMSDLVYLRRSRRPSISIGTGHKWLSRNLNGWPALFHALLCQPLHVLSDPVADSTTNQPRFANTEVAIYLESFFYSDSVCSLNPPIGYVNWYQTCMKDAHYFVPSAHHTSVGWPEDRASCIWPVYAWGLFLRCIMSPDHRPSSSSSSSPWLHQQWRNGCLRVDKEMDKS